MVPPTRLLVARGGGGPRLGAQVKAVAEVLLEVDHVVLGLGLLLARLLLLV